jgi:hypothetical protein
MYDAYEHGFEIAERDIVNGNPYNTMVYRTKDGDTASSDYQRAYADGYSEGWKEFDSIPDTELNDAYERGYDDAVSGRNYNPASRDPFLLSEYSRGWTQAKA